MADGLRSAGEYAERAESIAGAAELALERGNNSACSYYGQIAQVYATLAVAAATRDAYVVDAEIVDEYEAGQG